MRIVILLATINVLFWSCSFEKGEKGQAAPPIFKQRAIDSAYAPFRPAVQVFTIENQRVNRIITAGGSQVLIPANCLETYSGDKVEKIQLEIVEAFAVPAFITAGLTTLSSDRLLASNGMIYIDAKSGNENLKLVKGQVLTVSMPTMGSSNGFQIFTGKDGDWTPDSSMMAADYAILLPLDLLYPYGNRTFIHCSSSMEGKSDKDYFLDTTIVSVTDRKFENTVIATEEFTNRIYILWRMMGNMSFFTDKDYYFDKSDCTEGKYNYDIWKVYFDHPRRSFRESDSIAKRMYTDYFKMNKEKLASFCDQVNVHKRSYFSNWTDTNYFFDFRKTSLEEYFMSPLKAFPPTNTKEIKSVDNHGVDPDAADAFDQLKAKNIDINEINQIMSYNFRRKAIINILKKNKEVIVNKGKVEGMYASTVFSVEKMGWINCDRFYDDPTAGKAAIYVVNSSHTKLDFMDCSLVIPEVNARLSAYSDDAGRWAFTKKDGRYTRLPIGKEAIVVGVSLQKDSVFFASKRIKIADSLVVDLPMKFISKTVLNDSLRNAVRN